MKHQEKKEYLGRYAIAQKEIVRTRNELEQWRSIAEKITPTLSALPSGNQKSSRIENAVEKMDELLEMLNRRLGECVNLRFEIARAIESVPDARLRYLLELRYVNGRTIEEIAADMHYSTKQIGRLHEQAIAVLACPV